MKKIITSDTQVLISNPERICLLHELDNIFGVADHQLSGDSFSMTRMKERYPTLGKLFLKEAGTWLILSHPNIVKLHEANIFPIPYMELELCEKSLSELPKPTDTKTALKIALHIADALAYAHARGFVHRDVKPSNILLKNGLWKLSDWGLVKALDALSGTSRMFTPLYSAPEQIMPRKFGGVDEKTDIYLLGLVLYELLTGRKALGETMEEMIEAIAGRKEPDMSGVPEEVAELLSRCLSVEKGKRPGSMGEVKGEIGRLLGMRVEEEYEESVRTSDGRAPYLLLELVEVSVRGEAMEDAERYAEELASECPEFKELVEEIRWRAEQGIGADQSFVSRIEKMKRKLRGR
jgi:serine/threonine protein kinase